MGLFGKIFEKKICSICGGEIGLLGNRKLEDGNMCKSCASKLSPWFSDRRRSTVEQIKQQLSYREMNKSVVALFNTTRSYGDGMKLLIDEGAGDFTVTRSTDLIKTNPDIISISSVTGFEYDIKEHRTEDRQTDSEGRSVSYNPPRYFFSYDFEIKIRVNNPYFDEIGFKLNNFSVELNPGFAVPAAQTPDPRNNREYMKYYDMCEEIKSLLRAPKATPTQHESTPPKAEAKQIVCPYCGGLNDSNVGGKCAFCGGNLD